MALVIRYVILLQTKRKWKKNTKYHENFKTNTELSKFTDNTRPSNDDKTQKSRIGSLHRNQFHEGIQLT